MCLLAISDEIAGMEKDYVLNASENYLMEYLVAKYRIEPPTIRHEEIHALEPTDAKIDVSQDFARAVFDRSHPIYVTGTRVVVIVPFDGEAERFRLQPSTFALNPLRANIQGQERHLVFEGADLNGARLKQAYENELQRIEQSLRSVRGDVDQFNKALPESIRQSLSARKQKLLADAGLAAGFGVSSGPPPGGRRGLAFLPQFISPAIGCWANRSCLPASAGRKASSGFRW